MNRSMTAGGAGHVAGILQKGEEEEHEADRRDEGGYGSDAPPMPVARMAIDHPEPQLSTAPGRRQDGASKLVEKVNEGAAQVDGEHEHQVYGHKKLANPNAAQYYRIDTVGEGSVEVALFLTRSLSS